jgi:methyl-accepting chemotaxis protein
MATNTKQRADFLSNQSVARRIYALILIPLAILFITGIFAVIALNQDRLALSNISNHVIAIDKGNKIIRRMQSDYIEVLYGLDIGLINPEKGQEILKELSENLRESILPRYREAKSMDMDDAQSQQALDEAEKMLTTINKAIGMVSAMNTPEGTEQLKTYLHGQLDSDTKPLRDSIHKTVESDIQLVENEFKSAQQKGRYFLITTASLILLGTFIAAGLGYLIYQSIADSIEKLTSTMREISSGNLRARVGLRGRNELTELGDSFDRMVEERIATQNRIDREHRQLNHSVSSLLNAVFDLSERNLTVRAKVTEDATGPLADAINQLAEDTSEVLMQVREVATSVENASQEVNRHALSVNDLAQIEQAEAEETTARLETILQRLDNIAAAAQQANQVADNTSATTRNARETVSRSVETMTGIRNTVQETGKRLKRLGERSQEISQIIDVINNLSERTTVLALNASMQATAAGEAGRGFSMIAEEIQRLAENSRDSTNQISTLIRNIQQEANTTIATMEQTIEKVVNGASLAEEASLQMQATLDTTNQLVASVEQIANASAEQVSISKDLQTRAERILGATQSTGKELQALTDLTRNMVEYGQQLVQSVNVFKLEEQS